MLDFKTQIPLKVKNSKIDLGHSFKTQGHLTSYRDFGGFGFVSEELHLFFLLSKLNKKPLE